MVRDLHSLRKRHLRGEGWKEVWNKFDNSKCVWVI